MPDLSIVNLECRSKPPGETFDADEKEVIGFAVKNNTPYDMEDVTATIRLADPSLVYNARKPAGQRGDGAYILPDDRSFGNIKAGQLSRWREFSVWTSTNAPGGDYEVNVEFDYQLIQPDPKEREAEKIVFFTLDGSGGKDVQPDE